MKYNIYISERHEGLCEALRSEQVFSYDEKWLYKHPKHNEHFFRFTSVGPEGVGNLESAFIRADFSDDLSNILVRGEEKVKIAPKKTDKPLLLRRLKLMSELNDYYWTKKGKKLMFVIPQDKDDTKAVL